jgi:hypothetical protein
VIRHFQERMPYGLYVPDEYPEACKETPANGRDGRAFRYRGCRLDRSDSHNVSESGCQRVKG